MSNNTNRNPDKGTFVYPPGFWPMDSRMDMASIAAEAERWASNQQKQEEIAAARRQRAYMARLMDPRTDEEILEDKAARWGYYAEHPREFLKMAFWTSLPFLLLILVCLGVTVYSWIKGY